MCGELTKKIPIPNYLEYFFISGVFKRHENHFNLFALLVLRYIRTQIAIFFKNDTRKSVISEICT